MINRKKRQFYGSLEPFKSLGSRPQVSFKWGARPLDPLEQEDKRQRLLPPERLMADKLQLYKESLRKSLKTEKDFPKRVALETVLAENDLPKNIRDLQDREAEQFTKDFMCWLQGKHPKKSSDPAYISHRLKQYGVDPNHGPLHGPGVNEFLGSVVEKKAELHKKIALLAAGPDKMFPWTLEHYWLFYKYLCRDKPYLEDEMLYDFDQYWPNNQEGRKSEEYHGLGDPMWSAYGGRTKKEMKVRDECKSDAAKAKPVNKRGVPAPEPKFYTPPSSPGKSNKYSTPVGSPSKGNKYSTPVGSPARSANIDPEPEPDVALPSQAPTVPLDDSVPIVNPPEVESTEPDVNPPEPLLHTDPVALQELLNELEATRKEKIAKNENTDDVDKQIVETLGWLKHPRQTTLTPNNTPATVQSSATMQANAATEEKLAAAFDTVDQQKLYGEVNELYFDVLERVEELVDEQKKVPYNSKEWNDLQEKIVHDTAALVELYDARQNLKGKKSALHSSPTSEDLKKVLHRVQSIK